jgi:nitrite reductase/ring-hydroxylating ferredoxin subunit
MTTQTLDTAHPVALSRDIPPGTVTDAQLLGADLAIWRDPAGAIHVWEDVCPHRGVRLSFGFLRDGELACPYHGWRFGPDGQCVHIPANPDQPPPRSARVAVYDSGEAYGMVWVGPDGPANDEPPPAPIRTVTIRQPQATAAASVATLWPGLAPAGLVMQTATDHGRLVVGLQPVDERSTALHLVHAGMAPAGFLSDIAQRAAELRDALESTGAGP